LHVQLQLTALQLAGCYPRLARHPLPRRVAGERPFPAAWTTPPQVERLDQSLLDGIEGPETFTPKPTTLGG